MHGIDSTCFAPDNSLQLENKIGTYFLVVILKGDAAHRWRIANEIRKKKLGVRDKILEYMRRNVGKHITGEELRYIANDRSEWARRVRELRTEFGWPITTKSTGRPDLPVGVYALEQDRQSPPHDRKIPDSVRREVLRRDVHVFQMQVESQAVESF